MEDFNNDFSHLIMFMLILFQKCAPGFYRDRNGPYLGRCVPCDCSGLADECEESTGRCLVRNSFTPSSKHVQPHTPITKTRLSADSNMSHSLV